MKITIRKILFYDYFTSTFLMLSSFFFLLSLVIYWNERFSISCITFLVFSVLSFIYVIYRINRLKTYIMSIQKNKTSANIIEFKKVNKKYWITLEYEIKEKTLNTKLMFRNSRKIKALKEKETVEIIYDEKEHHKIFIVDLLKDDRND